MQGQLVKVLLFGNYVKLLSLYELTCMLPEELLVVNETCCGHNLIFLYIYNHMYKMKDMERKTDKTLKKQSICDYHCYTVHCVNQVKSVQFIYNLSSSLTLVFILY